MTELCQMKLLLIAATEFEILPIIKNEEAIAETNKKFDILITGVGLPATIYQLTKKLSEKKYDVVIQAGIAGSFSKKIKKGEVVFVKQDAFGDVGSNQKDTFKTLSEMGFEDANKFPFENGVLVNKSDITLITKLTSVKGVTVNKITDQKKNIKQLRKKFDAEVESMEGAALHYACLQQGVKFLQLRSISNYVGVRDKSKWKIKPAIENLNIELQRILNTIL